MFIIPQSIKNDHKLSKAFTLIELLIVITIIGILSGLLIVSISGVEERAKDSRIKSEMSQIRNIADIYKINNGFSYEELETNQEVSSLLSSITSQGGTAESNISISNDGSQYCIFTNLNSTNDLWCVDNTGYSGLGGCEEETYTCNSSIVGEGTTPEDIGFVENLSILHDAQYIDLVWAIPSSLTSTLSSSMISSAIVCVNSTEQISEPTDEDILNNGTLIDVINNANQEYRITVDNPDWYYYCKVFSYNNTTITNPGTIGGSVNTSFSTGGFSYPTSSGGSGGEPTTSNYYVSSQSTSNPLPAQNPPSLSGSTASGSSTTPNFTVSSERDPETGTGSITLSWTPGYLSTHTIIRRDVNTSPVSRTDGVEVYNQRNDSNNQDPTSIHYHTDNGLLDNTLYCYSAWAYDERTNTYSNGYVLVCGGISPSNPGNLLLTSNLDSITLSWTKGSSTNSVIRRAINTPPQNQNQGVLIYNQTESSFTDNSLLVANTTYCYSVWAYNPITGTFSDEYLSGCGSLLEQGDDPVLSPTNLTFPSVAYNSIVLNWAKGTGATKTLIVRKEGSIPLNKDDGTVVYLNTGNSFIDTNLSANTTYCYSLYSTNNEEDYYGSIGDCEQTLTKDTQSAPEAPTMDIATQTSIILNECSNGGCQYRMNSGTWQTSTTFSDLTANTSYSFTQRKAETESHFASEESSSASFSTAPKDTQSAPEAPTMNTATQTSIILNECSNGGCQYRMNSGTWQTSTTFSDLTANTSYSFAQRKAETENHFASEESSSASFDTLEPYNCGSSFIDRRDGNVYTTVQIGTQCWMAKNLAYLPSVVAGATGSTTTPYYYVYGYNGTDVATAKAQTNYATYGVLYNHPATVDACPTGWRMPTHGDWTDLERAICTSGTCSTDFPYDTSTTGSRGTNEGSKLSTFTLNGNNSSGFTALMSGFRNTDGSFYTVGSRTRFWSSSEGGAGAWYRSLYTSNSTVYRSTYSKAFGFSVRCLKD